MAVNQNMKFGTILKNEPYYFRFVYYSVKGKAIPLQAWTDPKDSRSFRLQDFKTIGLGRW